MKNRSRTIIIAVAVLVALFLLFRMRESYEGDDPSAGPTPEEESEEDPEVKKIVEEKGITQEDVDRLMSIL